MKTVISLLLAALMVWTIAGCGSKAAQAESAGHGTQARCSLAS